MKLVGIICSFESSLFPMYFKNVLGHESVKTSLLKAIHDGHVGHALMFFGKDGSGNLPLAIAFGAYILCENPGEFDRCGVCASCKQLDAWTHPDLHFSFPIVKTSDVKTSKPLQNTFVDTIKKEPYLSLKGWEQTIAGENKKSLIPADESDEIVKSLSLKSFRGGFKVLIIWRADKMNGAASNKILKTLEEPTSKTLVILVVNKSEDLLPTIVSRTQLINCGNLLDEEIANAILTDPSLEIDENRANEIARVSDGDFFKARQMVSDSSNNLEHLEIFSRWMRACVQHNITDALSVCEELSKLNKDGQQNFLEYSMNFIHKSILFFYVNPKASRLDSSALKFAERFAPFMMEADLGGFHDILSRGHFLIARNANSQLLFLKMSKDIMAIYNKRSQKH